mmetsp:Transcript_7293/g.15783  ORF Transcript_7293/g.15783 Transcript_7293/m.15783 type:complete len:355 (+) Transcript_7293:59-1123(+)
MSRTNDSPPAANGAPSFDHPRHVASVAKYACTDEDAKQNAITAAKTDDAALLEEYSTTTTTVTTPPRPKSRGGGPASSCKRRRLAPEHDENYISEMAKICSSSPTHSFAGSPRKLNYVVRSNYSNDDTSDDSDDEHDPVDHEIAQMRQESILKKIQRLNYEDEDKLLHTTAFAKLFEFVKDYDIVAKTSSSNTSPVRPRSEDGKGGSAADKGEWKYRGSGYVKFIKCMEEGYNCGMIRAELTKNGTLETLMCHELTDEEVGPMPSKQGKAYTWRCKDWAYRTATRTFAIRFDDDMDALKWKEELERSKRNNRYVRTRRMGLSVLDISAEVDDVCSTFQNLSTSVSSPLRVGSGK